MFNFDATRFHLLTLQCFSKLALLLFKFIYYPDITLTPYYYMTRDGLAMLFSQPPPRPSMPTLPYVTPPIRILQR